jgi:DNA polymerase-3 subunit epsilon
VSLLAGQKLVVVDTETTGLEPSEGHVLLEVATVALEDGVVGETWSSLVRPGRSIPLDAIRVHGITDELVAEAPGPATVASELRSRCATYPLVFHNAGFDLPFLIAALREAGQPPLINLIVDTLGLARGLFGVGDNSLGRLAARLGVNPGRAHRALADALTTTAVFLELARRYESERGVKSVTELAATSQAVLRATRG